MSLNLRIPFDNVVGSRDATTEKDSITTNVFFDNVVNDVAIVKRPGLENKTSALGLGISGALGLGQGIFYYEDKVYSFNSIDPGTVWVGFAVKSDRAVLISGAGLSTKIRNLAITTDDELDYTEQATGAGIDGGFVGLFWTGSKFVAYGNFTSSKFISTSTDGISWTTVYTISSPTTGDCVGTTNGTTLVLIDSSANNVITSIDNGVSWTETNIAKGSTENRAIAVLGTRFTIGSFHSLNGTTWTACTGTGAGPMKHIASNGSYLLAFRSDTTGVKFSNNGTVWSNFTPVGAETSSISAGGLFAWNGTLWCCVTNDGKAFTSTDGTNWTKGNRSESVYVIPNNLVFFEGAFYCLSQTPASTVGNPYNLSFIEKSVDGINWQTTIVDLALFDETPTLISGLV